MNVASLKLCKELFELSKWNETDLNWYRNYDDAGIICISLIDGANGVYLCPAYDLGYLLRKLPKSITEIWGYAYPVSPVLMYSGSQWVALYKSEMTGEYNDDDLFNEFADTPEDAVCMLAIELFKQDILQNDQH